MEHPAGDRGIVIDADRMRSAQAKWDRLTIDDYAEIRTIARTMAAAERDAEDNVELSQSQPRV